MLGRSRSPLLAVASTLLIGACSDSTSPNAPSVPDIAALLKEASPAVLAGVASISSPELGLAMANTPAFSLASCPYDVSQGFFVCQSTSINGFRFSRSFRLLDATNQPQALPTTSTVAIEVKTLIQGTTYPTVNGIAVGVTDIFRNDDMTLSGLHSRQQTLNGTSSSTVTEALSAVGSVPTTYQQSDTTSALVLPDATSGQRWPQSGTITSRQTITVGSAPTGLESRAVVVFNGTSTITVTITNDAGTTTCRYDLSSPVPSCS